MWKDQYIQSANMLFPKATIDFQCVWLGLHLWLLCRVQPVWQCEEMRSPLWIRTALGEEFSEEGPLWPAVRRILSHALRYHQDQRGGTAKGSSRQAGKLTSWSYISDCCCKYCIICISFKKNIRRTRRCATLPGWSNAYWMFLTILQKLIACAITLTKCPWIGALTTYLAVFLVTWQLFFLLLQWT